MRNWGGVPIAVLAAVLVTAAMPAMAEGPPPTVDATSNKTVYVAGQTADIAATVSNAGASTHLKVVASYANGSVKTLDDTDVYSGTKHYAVYMVIDTRIDVYLAGATEPDQTLVIPVQAAIGSAIGGYYQKAGSYALFARGSEPLFKSATTPAHAGRCIRHEVWRQYASGWKPILLSSCKQENAQGVVSWRWVGTHGSGVNFRVRAKFLGDRLNHPNAGKFIYFRFK